MKKKVVLVISLIFIFVLAFISGRIVVKRMISSQYNSNGISHFLVITIDENQSKEFIGQLDEHDIPSNFIYSMD